MMYLSFKLVCVSKVSDVMIMTTCPPFTFIQDQITEDHWQDDETWEAEATSRR